MITGIEYFILGKILAMDGLHKHKRCKHQASKVEKDRQVRRNKHMEFSKDDSELSYAMSPVKV